MYDANNLAFESMHKMIKVMYFVHYFLRGRLYRARPQYMSNLL